ncbi:hypothetical protein [Brucella intermedia]|uniref:hypothetical protein n=1 Tax=Brucella intermedia TaxID=94625 RepID=UPI00124DE271|nr:hypothetical protein [Brucella intermedia]KAB2721492.1 hypothetical protein F9L02_23090 [Brucella intermedia]
MILFPFEKVAEIDTGNPYTGFTSISGGEKFVDTVVKFPRHEVFVKSKKSLFPTSILSNGIMHVYYDENGCVVGIELMVPELNQIGHSLTWNKMKITPEMIVDVAEFSKSSGLDYKNTGYGFDIPEIGLSYYSANFDDTMQSKLDSVYINLKGAS